MRLYGITGGIGSGKSAVTAILRDMGLSVLDLDEISRELVVPGSEGLRRIVAVFGPDHVRPNGTLDRSRLAGVVFSDEAALASLDAIMGPLLRAEIARRGSLIEAPLAFVDGALLIEKKMHADLAGLVLVTAPQDVRVRRVMARDGLDAQQVYARMRAQMSDEEKTLHADILLSNEGTLADLEIKVRAMVEILR